jgi:hypothetical protein
MSHENQRAHLARVLAARKRDLDPMTAAMLPAQQDLARTMLRRLDAQEKRDVLADESVDEVVGCTTPPLVLGGQGRALDESAQAFAFYFAAALLLIAGLICWRIFA